MAEGGGAGGDADAVRQARERRAEAAVDEHEAGQVGQREGGQLRRGVGKEDDRFMERGFSEGAQRGVAPGLLARAGQAVAGKGIGTRGALRGIAGEAGFQAGIAGQEALGAGLEGGLGHGGYAASATTAA